jgi:hypothetical protein
MTMLEPRIREELERLIAKTPPERIQRLLSDIKQAGTLPMPTHEATKQVQ